MFTFIVTELSNAPVPSVTDGLRSPVMQVLATGSFGLVYFLELIILPRTLVERRASVLYNKATGSN